VNAYLQLEKKDESIDGKNHHISLLIGQELLTFVVEACRSQKVD